MEIISLESLNYYVILDDTFATHNPLEFVAYLLRNHKVDGPTNSAWDFSITSDDWDRSYFPSAIYWLSGGDREWIYGRYYTKEWAEVRDFYCNYFSPLFYDSLHNVETLGDVLSIFREKFNLALFYEFGLAYSMILREGY